MATRRRQPPRESDIPALRREYLAALEPLAEASRRVHQALDEAAATLEIVRDHIQQDRNISDFAGIIDPIPLRTALATALNDLEYTRHQTQRLLFRLLHAEGMSMSDIGRTWGISRQLVSRLINEPEKPHQRDQRPSTAISPSG